jgi:hypothetical protein
MRIPAPTWMIVAGLAMAAALPDPAVGQTLAAIRGHIVAANPGCDIARLAESHRGAIPGGAGHVVVVTYTVEACNRGNNFASVFGVFSEQNGRVVEYQQPEPPGFLVESVRVAQTVIEVQGLGYAPTDGRCCPSLRSRARYRLEGRQVVPAP